LVEKLADLRGAHNLWYVYSKPQLKEKIKNALKLCVKEELRKKDCTEYAFESVLDNTGYRFFEILKNSFQKYGLWEILFY
jgi:hypothetical protein